MERTSEGAIEDRNVPAQTKANHSATGISIRRMLRILGAEIMSNEVPVGDFRDT